MASCIYCESSESLNTRLDITLDNGSKVTVHICDTHAEDASVKSARSLYLKRQTQIQELLEQAKKLGFELSSTSSGLTVAKQSTKAQPEQAKQRQLEVEEVDPTMMDSAMVDARSARGISSKGGEVSGYSVQSYREHGLSEVREKLPEGALEGKVKMELVEGRSGVPIAIPTKRVDGIGTTHIKIIPTSDTEIQKRFKNIADASRSDGGWEAQPDFRHGYDIKSCPLCRGDATVKDRGKVIECPKCKGRGTI